jgi:hAT family C-terminal dimerisation region
VQISVAALLNHCDSSDMELEETIEGSVSVANMKSKFEAYERKLVQLPAIVASYLNPQIQKPTDAVKLKDLKATIRTVLKNRYSDKLHAIEPRPGSIPSSKSVFEVLFSGRSSGGVVVGGSSRESDVDDPCLGDEVDRYLAMGIVEAESFIDVIQWWIARKDKLPAHYHMAMDYLGTPATSTPSERVNSMAGREFTAARQSLSSEIFVKTMCLRSWMNLGIISIPQDRHKAITTMAAPAVGRPTAEESIDSVVDMIETEQNEWTEEAVETGAVNMLNIQFNTLLMEESDMLM